MAELSAGLCKPSGDLRFVLANFPRLGSVCRIHTTSYRSIRQIHSALEEIQTFTGGRLAGITAKLVVRPEQATYYDRKEQRKKATTIWALNLEVDGDDIRKLVAKLTGSARLFAETRKLLGWGDRAIQVVEDEEEQAPEIVSEFYPPSDNARDSSQPPGEMTKDAQAPTDSTARGRAHGLERRASNAARKELPRRPIVERKRKAEPTEGEAQNAHATAPAASSGEDGATPAETASPGQRAHADGHSKMTKLRGVVGRLEPDAAGKTIRRTAKNIEYVLFTMGVNGSKAKVYCKQPGLMPEISRREGREAVAEVEVATDGTHPCYILYAFVEG
jgi:hypothetical protein